MAPRHGGTNFLGKIHFNQRKSFRRIQAWRYQLYKDKKIKNIAGILLLILNLLKMCQSQDKNRVISEASISDFDLFLTWIVGDSLIK